MARLVGGGQHVLIFGRDPAALRRTLDDRGCQAVIVDPDHEDYTGLPVSSEGGPGTYDAVIVSDALGRIDDPSATLRALKEQIRPGGSLIVTLANVAPIAGRLAIVDGGPLGEGSGVVFTEEGLLGLIESSGYAIAHIEPTGPVPEAAAPVKRDHVVVAHPLPSPGLAYIQQKMRALAEAARVAAREAEVFRGRAAQAEQRLEIMAGHERRQAARINDLRARLLDAHEQMIRRDDEMRKTFGDAIYLRNALLIERDTLTGQRDGLFAERNALLEERDALVRSLGSAERRLNLLRSTPFGLAYRVLRKLVPRRGSRGRDGSPG